MPKSRTELHDTGGRAEDLEAGYKKVFFGVQFAIALYAYENIVAKEDRLVPDGREQVGFDIWSEDDEYWSYHANSASVFWIYDLIDTLQKAREWVEANCDFDEFHTALWRANK